MENSFDHAKEYANQFFQKIGRSLDHSSAVQLMTEWASQFTENVDKVVAKVNTAPLEAEIASLKAIIAKKDADHAEALKALQPQPEVPQPEPKTKTKKAE